MSLSVNVPEKRYQEQQEAWKTCRDVIEGKRSVFMAGEEYLPKLSEQTEDEYDAYQLRAGWYGAADRTKTALKGMIFRKDPVIQMDSEKMQPFLEDATTTGISLKGLSSMAIDEILETGRGGLLVDYQKRPSTEIETQAEAEALNRRAYVQLYKAEQIIGVTTDTIDNQTIVTQIRLREVEEKVSTEDEFKKKTSRVIRVLEINEAGIYQQRIFREEHKSEDDSNEGDFGKFVQDGEPIVPRKLGEPFRKIPFYFLGVQDMDVGYDKPPLLDLCEVNLDYYRTKADYKHGLHFTGLPTAVITGHSSEGTTYRIGSMSAWIFPESDANAKYLEFTGQGLSELREELMNLKSDMASLGARMLASEKKQTESAESHQIKRSGEHSLLASVANNCSEALTLAANEAASWEGVDEEISIRLNTDFITIAMDGKEVLDLWKVYQGGGMIYEDFLWNLHQGERINPDIDDDERQNKIQTSINGGSASIF